VHSGDIKVENGLMRARRITHRRTYTYNHPDWLSICIRRQ